MKKSHGNLSALLNILKDGLNHDGDSIGQQLKISRAAVWKIIKKLIGYGVEINSVKGKGYILVEPLILLDSEYIKNNVSTKKLCIEVFESIDSTNDYLKKYFNSQMMRICLAELQTKGKGRLLRYWHSPFGQNIYFSLLYPFAKDISALNGLSLIVSLAIHKTLSAYTHDQKIWVKWPNDILYYKQKLAGTLIEVHAESNGSSEVIIGIGINVNMLQAAEEISQPWTSLRQITGTYFNRNEICIGLIDNLLIYLKLFEAHGLKYFMGEWQNCDFIFDQEVIIINANSEISGLAKGINAEGHLLLQMADGSLKAFCSGDASLKKNESVVSV